MHVRAASPVSLEQPEPRRRPHGDAQRDARVQPGPGFGRGTGVRQRPRGRSVEEAWPWRVRAVGPAPSRHARSRGTCTPGNWPGIRSTPPGSWLRPSRHEAVFVRAPSRRAPATFRPPSAQLASFHVPSLDAAPCREPDREHVAPRAARRPTKSGPTFAGCSAGPISRNSDVLNERGSPVSEVPG